MIPDDATGRGLGFNIFNLEEADEPIKGKPRTIRLERTDYPLGQPAASQLAITDYDIMGRVVERRVYRPDNTLSFHEVFRYEADPQLYAIQVLDADGAIVSTRKILAHPKGEESTVFGKVGEIREKTRTRRDPQGRVIEAVSEDALGGEKVHMRVDYRGGRTEAHVTFTEGSRSRRDMNVVAGPEGTSLSYRDSAGRAHEFLPTKRRTVVQSTDAAGNWTRKTTVERSPATGEEVVTASTHRTITYYPD